MNTPAILDGEIVCLDAEGKSQFRPLMSRKSQVSFYAFDLLWLGDKDLRGLPLVKRKQHLQKLLAKTKLPAVVFASHIEEKELHFIRKYASGIWKASLQAEG